MSPPRPEGPGRAGDAGDPTASELAGLDELLADPEPERFGHFVARTDEGLLPYFYRRVRDDPDLVADLVAETYLAALQSRHRFDPSKGTAIGWLYGIARNQLRLYFRRSRVEREGQQRLGAAAPRIDERTLEYLDRVESNVDFEAAIREALSDLPDQQRDVVRLRIDEELSHAEIAERLGISEANSRVRLHRAVHAIQERLGR